MKIFEANISYQVSDLLKTNLNKIKLFETANHKIFEICGIRNFFNNNKELLYLKEHISITQNIIEEPDRAEYGDFQTNIHLAKSVAVFLKEKKINPKIIIEPTFGKGNFIIASLEAFPNAEKIIGVEIYKPYVWETKFNIIQFYIDNPRDKKPVIEINHFNVFDFDFKSIAIEHSKDETLIVGNPPWITNSKLSSLESDNLPVKSNFKKHSGYDAMTGKGNFDIGEYITLMMFDAFQNSKGHFAFLVKNSVIKNVIFDQKQRRYNISDLQKLTIDSKKEFNVSVEAALFFCKLNSPSEFTCTEFNFYNQTKLINQRNLPIGKFGWVKEKFVSNIDFYVRYSDIDGLCPFEWRQGIKHDLSSIMEIERINGHFINGLHQEFNLEEDLVYGLLKSSDLKQLVIDKTRKYTIITQKKIGQDTSFIKKEFPKIFNYLHKNKTQFDSRKSSIYNNKPAFSIFGIGDYSFAPYKISISGLYKTFTFSLILQQDNKPIMLDDTCYLLGFDDIDYAAYTLIILNSEKTKALLQSITFSDAKRTFTKEILMRIDLYNLALHSSKINMQQELEKFNKTFKLKISFKKWNDYLSLMKPVAKHKQMKLFV